MSVVDPADSGKSTLLIYCTFFICTVKPHHSALAYNKIPLKEHANLGQKNCRILRNKRTPPYKRTPSFFAIANYIEIKQKSEVFGEIDAK